MLLYSNKHMDAVDKLFYQDTRRYCDRMDNATLMTAKDGSGSTRIVQECFAALEETLTDSSTQLLLEQPCHNSTPFHTVWVGQVHRTVRLSLMSVVYSHPPGCVKMNLWTVDDQSRAAAHKTLLPYFPSGSLHVRVLHGTTLAMTIREIFPSLGPVLDEKESIFSDLNEPGDQNLAAYSDAIRFLVLAAYGGVYMDADVLVMRSFQPLLSRDFWYRWSTQSFCNTAVLHMKKGSLNLFNLLQRTLRESSSVTQLGNLLSPVNVHARHDAINGGVEMLPSAYFDPTWVMYDVASPAITWTSSKYGMTSFPMFFQNPAAHVKSIQRPEEFVTGCFAYHWHNQWESEFEELSVAAVFERYFESIATERKQ